MAPIACSLNTTEAARQAVDWHQLGRRALSVVIQDGRLIATFPIEASAQVDALAAREAACCGFLSIGISHTADAVRLEIDGTESEARSVVEALGAVIGT